MNQELKSSNKTGLLKSHLLCTKIPIKEQGLGLVGLPAWVWEELVVSAREKRPPHSRSHRTPLHGLLASWLLATSLQYSDSQKTKREKKRKASRFGRRLQRPGQGARGNAGRHASFGWLGIGGAQQETPQNESPAHGDSWNHARTERRGADQGTRRTRMTAFGGGRDGSGRRTAAGVGVWVCRYNLTRWRDERRR
ncbi:hypothetical protein BD289DRAFT_230478 [Coniella lustricola]|uniref:Uncharacterized protein n=1 Tax=Coniella lustricola TaxID=2025994 RepID=A0A2T3AAC4_9PEZI|nr:hypothetical protein BD289DRAFT_230478 [Coniella lustricola]